MNNHQPIRVNQKHKKWLFSRETLNSNLKVRDIRTFVPVCTLLKDETSYITTIIQCTFNVSPNKHHRSALSFIFSCSRRRFSACKTKPRTNENMSDTASYNAPNVACSKFTITISCCCCLFLHYFNSGLGTLVHPEHSCPLDSVQRFSKSFAVIGVPDRIRRREISLIFHTLRTQRSFRSHALSCSALQTTAIAFSESLAHILLVQCNPALRRPR